jgi:hypothetical protein
MGLDALETAIADAIIGIDTVWGGDVMNPSGTGRFIADSWFSDEPLPRSYTHPLAAVLREKGGVSARAPDADSLRSYQSEIGLAGAIAQVVAGGRALGGLRGAHIEGLGLCCEVMLELALEITGDGPAVSYERCVRTLTGSPPRPSEPGDMRRRVAELLRAEGYASRDGDSLVAAVDAWRAARRVPAGGIAALGDELIKTFNALCERNLVPHLPAALAEVPRANVRFLPIENAWFSGSMNYLGRARRADGSPEYDATYELNASLEISLPEFEQLVSHEVVPGHVTTFAYLQNLYVRGRAGFEVSVQAMNTRDAVISEGIANNAILIAHGITELSELPDRTLELGVLLALLQDDAKNQASYLTWQEGAGQPEVAANLRRDYLVSAERADKLSGAWARHPLLGRMYLPAYKAGTELVADLRRHHPPEVVLPALYGVHGAVDCMTLPALLDGTLEPESPRRQGRRQDRSGNLAQ